MTSRISRKSSALVSSAGNVARDARRIDQPADQAEPVDHLVEGVGDLILVGDVGLQENRILVGEGALGRASASASASTTATGQPSSSRRSTTAMPIPEAPPVTIAGMLHLMRSRIET